MKIMKAMKGKNETHKIYHEDNQGHEENRMGHG